MSYAIQTNTAQRVRSEAAPPHLVVRDLSASPYVDLQAIDALEGLASELKAMGGGIKLQVVEARASVRDMLRAEGLDETLGGINRVSSVADAVESFEKTPPPP